MIQSATNGAVKAVFMREGLAKGVAATLVNPVSSVE
ncbi:MAG: hypothetical protein ACI82A_004128 [Candidatus Azotimanducaceae bacterium]|jgi:hypothetical protein